MFVRGASTPIASLPSLHFTDSPNSARRDAPPVGGDPHDDRAVRARRRAATSCRSSARPSARRACRAPVVGRRTANATLPLRQVVVRPSSERSIVAEIVPSAALARGEAARQRVGRRDLQRRARAPGVTVPSAAKLPLARDLRRRGDVAARAARAHGRLDLEAALGQRAQRDDRVAGAEDVARRRDERAAAEVAARRRRRLGDGGRGGGQREQAARARRRRADA